MTVSTTILIIAAAIGPIEEVPTKGIDDEIAVLIEALDHKDEKLRASAVAALGYKGAKAVDAGPKLVALLDSKHWPQDGRPNILIQSLARIDAPIVPLLLEAGRGDNPYVTQGAALALARMREVSPEAVPIFQRMLRSEVAHTRRIAVLCLSEVDAETSVPEFTKALSDKDGDVRDTVISAIARMGPNAQEAFPTLMEMLKDERENPELIIAIGKIGGAAKPAVPILVELMQSESPVRQVAVQAVGNIGPVASDAVGALTRLLEDASSDVRIEAAIALGKIGPSANEAVPALNRQARLLRVLESQGLRSIAFGASTTKERSVIDDALERITADDDKKEK